MKAVVGVGFQGHTLVGVELLARLAVPGTEAVLIHTVEPVLPDGGFVPDTSMGAIADIQRQRKQDGERRMAEVAAVLSKAGIPSSSMTTYGFPAHEITDLADRERADVVVVGSDKKSGFESFLMGSVSRALVTSCQASVLVGKAALSPGDKIDAVFATDHSDYAARCAAHLAALAPRGLGTVTVVCADTSDDDVREALQAHDPQHRPCEQILQEKNDATARVLSGACEKTASLVLRGKAESVLDAAMKTTKSDLLVLGAHGRGFMERLMMGSTAVHMVGNAPWNVLVVRA